MSPIKYLNGLGLVATGKRQIADGRQYDKYFAEPLREDPYLTYSGTTHDTIQFMADIIKKTTDDTKEIAKVLRKRSLNETLKNIFDFVFNHIQYKPDDPTTEELRRPVRVWADRHSGVDCDCYSIFIGSILSNLKIPFALRMVKINGKSYFQHVYVIVPKNGKASGLKNRNDYYVIDPVLDTYNEEHPFTENYDVFMQPIKYLNGGVGVSVNGLNGAFIGNPLHNSVYYSDEAAEYPHENVIFFDGINYYERNPEFAGLGSIDGLNGLGFLRKIFTLGKSIFKGGGKVIKKIARPIVYKKDGTKRKFFKRIEERRNARKLKRLKRQDARRMSEMPMNNDGSLRKMNTKSIEQDTFSLPRVSATQVFNDVNKNINDNIKTVLDTVSMKDDMLKELVNAKVEANKGLSTQEAMQIAEQSAKAEKSSVLMDVLKTIATVKEILPGSEKQQYPAAPNYDNYYSQPARAGFGSLNLQTALLGLVGGGLLFAMLKK